MAVFNTITVETTVYIRLSMIEHQQRVLVSPFGCWHDRCSCSMHSAQYEYCVIDYAVPEKNHLREIRL